MVARANPGTRNGRQNFRTSLGSIGHCVSARLGSCRCSHASGYRSHQGKAELGRGHGRRGAQELCGRPQQAIPPQHVRPRGQDAQRSPAPAKELASSKFAPVTSSNLSVQAASRADRTRPLPDARIRYILSLSPRQASGRRCALPSEQSVLRPTSKLGPPLILPTTALLFGHLGPVATYSPM